MGHIHACKTLLNFGANVYAKDIVSLSTRYPYSYYD